MSNRWIEYTVSFICILCGRVVGDPITSAAPIGPTAPRACATCGGSAVVQEMEARSRLAETGPIDMSDLEPRRGRPPQRLVEQRRREKEANDAAEQNATGVAP